MIGFQPSLSDQIKYSELFQVSLFVQYVYNKEAY